MKIVKPSLTLLVSNVARVCAVCVLVVVNVRLCVGNVLTLGLNLCTIRDLDHSGDTFCYGDAPIGGPEAYS